MFILVKEEATRGCRGEGPFEFFNADDLVLTTEIKKEARNVFLRWKESMKRRGLKINTEKTKVDGVWEESREDSAVRKVALWSLWMRSWSKIYILCYVQ